MAERSIPMKAHTKLYALSSGLVNLENRSTPARDTAAIPATKMVVTSGVDTDGVASVRDCKRGGREESAVLLLMSTACAAG